MRPVIFANKVSSLPRPTLSPGFTRVPRCLTMIVPPGTSCPPKALNPSRCAFESRPFRELPKPFLCAITRSSALPAFDRQLNFLLLFLRCSFLRCRLLGGLLFRRLCLRLYTFARRRLLRLCFLLGQLGSLERLSAECDLGDAHCGEGLPMSAHLLVLLLALVMEDQDFRRAALLDHLADH